jgi:hypothetical protein
MGQFQARRNRIAALTTSGLVHAGIVPVKPSPLTSLPLIQKKNSVPLLLPAQSNISSCSSGLLPRNDFDAGATSCERWAVRLFGARSGRTLTCVTQKELPTAVRKLVRRHRRLRSLRGSYVRFGNREAGAPPCRGGGNFFCRRLLLRKVSYRPPLRHDLNACGALFVGRGSARFELGREGGGYPQERCSRWGRREDSLSVVA